jgi:surface carbohydrate biosynthesis protein
MTVIYLLVEESFREMTSRIFIGTECLARGLDVVIAQQWWFGEHMAEIPRGVVLFKGNNRTQAALMKNAKSCGHRITSIEEEAFGVNYDLELATMFSSDAMDAVDMVFVQGTNHRDFLVQRFPAVKDRIAVTGNPRSDFLSLGAGAASSEKAAALRRETGEFVLVNTNCGAINPYDIDTFSHYSRCESVGVLHPSDPDDMARFESLMAWEHSNLREVSRFLRGFSEKCPSVPVILRPHPSENFTRWEKACAALDNVSVVNDKDHITWMLAARVIVHTGCTTGLEGALLGVPVVGICPDKHPWHEGFISNIVSHVRSTGAEACETVMEHLTSDKPTLPGMSEKELENLQPFLMVERSTSASGRIAEAVVLLATALSTDQYPYSFGGFTGTPANLRGRRSEKAFMSLSEFEKSKASIEAALNFQEQVTVTELGPTVFWMKAA